MIQHRTFHYNQKFNLESGKFLPSFDLAYSTFGKLNADKSNVVWVCHALTGNDDVIDWWKDFFGKGKLFDPEEYFIVCANTLGSCYGSTGPLSVNPITEEPYFHTFPLITIRDITNSFNLLREHLELPSIQLLMGGSMGGQAALEWAIMYPEVVKNMMLTATNAQHSPWGIAFNETQRMAIQNDSTWKSNQPDAGLRGMEAARAMAMLSYRNYKTYEKSQRDENDTLLSGYKATTYQHHQGKKLAQRFNAYSYWTLSSAMDTHNIGRNRGEIHEVLKGIQAETLVIGIDTDILFPTHEQRLLAEHIPNASYAEIASDYGHDGFLVETKAMAREIDFFLVCANIGNALLH